MEEDKAILSYQLWHLDKLIKSTKQKYFYIYVTDNNECEMSCVFTKRKFSNEEKMIFYLVLKTKQV